MDSFEIKPTEEYLLRTYTNDYLGRVGSINAFVKIIDSIDGGSSIAIDSAWGSGKTFFVKQAKMVIDSQNPNSSFASSNPAEQITTQWSKYQKDYQVQPMITTYYDAWEHDDETDPLLSLIYEVMKENYCYCKIQNKRDWSVIFTEIANLISPKNIGDLVNALKGNDRFEISNSKAELSERIDEFFKSLLPENGNKLVLFIDELDRCSPAYAVKLLERIKHYMNNEGLIFVFSINQIELQKTIRKFYGYDFDACRYLDRFFDIRIALPPLDSEKLMKFIGLPSHPNLRETTCFEFIKQTGMSLREIRKYLAISKCAAHSITDSNMTQNRIITAFEKNAMILAFDVIVPIIIGLRITDIDSYKRFVDGSDSFWLQRIILSDSLFDWVFNYLLDEPITVLYREQISEEDSKERVDSLYKAIFTKTYEGNDFETRVGRIVITANTKMRILEAVNMLSEYTEFV